jgi:hypothetical protein
VSGMPGASPVDQGQARGAEHRIGPGRIDRVFGARDGKRKNIRRAPNTFGVTLGDTARDAQRPAIFAK